MTETCRRCKLSMRMLSFWWLISRLECYPKKRTEMTGRSLNRLQIIWQIMLLMTRFVRESVIVCVVQELQNKYGVDPKRLSAAGRGEYNPITDNDSELGKQRNRRTQIIVTPRLDQFLELIDKAPEAEGEKEGE